MTVQELISRLQNLPQDMTVLVHGAFGGLDDAQLAKVNFYENPEYDKYSYIDLYDYEHILCDEDDRVDSSWNGILLKPDTIR